MTLHSEGPQDFRTLNWARSLNNSNAKASLSYTSDARKHT